jgi:hypothetical protein
MTAAELIALLSELPPDALVLVDGCEGGFERAGCSVIEVQELRGLPDWYGHLHATNRRRRAGHRRRLASYTGPNPPRAGRRAADRGSDWAQRGMTLAENGIPARG